MIEGSGGLRDARIAILFPEQSFSLPGEAW